MKFQIIEKIKLRNDIIKYFNDITSLKQYNIYIGIINNYFGLLITDNEVNDEMEIDNIIQIKYNNQNKLESIFLYKIGKK